LFLGELGTMLSVTSSLVAFLGKRLIQIVAKNFKIKYLAPVTSPMIPINA
jgi:hypothetical protein